jgi:hypothetical protein
MIADLATNLLCVRVVLLTSTGAAGYKTWCECECDGSVDWGMYEADPDEGLKVDNGLDS